MSTENETRRIVREEIARALTEMRAESIRHAEWSLAASIERGIATATGVYYMLERIDGGHAEWLTPDDRWTTEAHKARRFDDPRQAGPWMSHWEHCGATITGHMDCAGPDLRSDDEKAGGDR